MIRVTFASYDDDPPEGGQGVALQGMRTALQNRGIHVHTVSGRGTHAVAYARISRRAPVDLSLQLNRNRLILYRDEPSLIHAFGGPGGVLIWRPLLVPLVYTAHHTYRQAYRRAHLRRATAVLEARAYRRAAIVLAVSRSTADAVLAMGIPAARVEIVGNGVELPAADGSAREPSRMLFVGRLEAEKGVADALEVMRAMCETRAEARGVVIGTGRLTADVRRSAEGSGGRIEYLGRVDAATLQREYARAAMLIAPSRYEGLGMAALEAQAAGTPVIGYEVDGLRDSVRDGGVLVDAGDVAALQQACAALLDDPTRRDELGARGREFVRREHSWATIAAQLEDVYRAVLASGERAGVQ